MISKRFISTLAPSFAVGDVLRCMSRALVDGVQLRSKGYGCEEHRTKFVEGLFSLRCVNLRAGEVWTDCRFSAKEIL